MEWVHKRISGTDKGSRVRNRLPIRGNDDSSELPPRRQEDGAALPNHICLSNVMEACKEIAWWTIGWAMILGVLLALLGMMAYIAMVTLIKAIGAGII